MRKSQAVALLLMSCLTQTHLFSLPVVKQIKHGKVQVAETTPGQLQITASDKAVIHFDHFDIGAHEAVQFIQPGKSAKALGKISGHAVSEIHGSLLSNGQIFLVNPHGFVFGKTAQVNVGALIASALDIADQDFVKDKYHFVLDSSESTAKIINHGSLISHSGPIALLAPEISNQGVIRAVADKVVLASAERVVLDFDGDKLLRFEVSGELAQGKIDHEGTIQALQGGVFMNMKTAARVIQDVVNADGIVAATGIVEENGYIALVDASLIESPQVIVDAVGPCGIMVAGDIVAKQQSGMGGHVEILGDSISLHAAMIDASGEKGGGTVLVGGDYLGKGTSHVARNTYVLDMSSISVDAIREGNGGKAILWADEQTLFEGFIYARGGKEGGNGGFVETSGKEFLSVAPLSNVYTFSPQGEPGMWHLDPSSITIMTGGGCTVVTASNCADMMPCVIDPMTIANSMTPVTLCAPTILQVNDINMGMSNIIFQASTSTTLNGTIATAGSVSFTSTGSVVLAGTTTIAANGISFTSSNPIDGNFDLNLTSGGNVSVASIIGGMTPIAVLNITAPTVSLLSINTTGSCTITHTGNASLSGAIAVGGPFLETGGGNLDLSTTTFTSNGTNIQFNGPTRIISNVSISTSIGTGDIVFSQDLTPFSATSSLQLAAGTTSGTITLQNATGVPVFDTITAIAGSSGTLNCNGIIGARSGITLQAGQININADISNAVSNFVTIYGNAVNLINAAGTKVTISGTSSGIRIADFLGTGLGAINGTLSCGQGLDLIASTSTISLNASVGNTIPLSSFGMLAASSILQNGPVFACQSVGYSFTGAGSRIIFLNEDITVTQPNSTILLNGNIRLGSDVELVGASSGSITLIGNVDATTACPAESLNLLSLGTVTLNANIGTNIPLKFLNVTANNIVQNGNLRVCQDVNYTGSSGITLGGGEISTIAGNIDLTGPITISSTQFLINTSMGSRVITLTGSINGRTNNGQSLNLAAGAGDINIHATIGQAIPLRSFNILSGGTVTLTDLISVGTGGTSLSANRFNSSSFISSQGPLTILASDLFTSLGGSFFSAGAMSVSGAGAVEVSGQIVAEGGFFMQNPLILEGNLSVSTQICDKSVTFAGAISGPYTLTVNALKLNLLGPVNPEVNVVFNECVPIGTIKLASMYIPGIYSSTFNLGSLYYFMPDLITEQMAQMPNPWFGYGKKAEKQVTAQF